MDQQKYLNGVSVVIGLFAAIALVVTVAFFVQAAFLGRAEEVRVEKLDRPENVEFALEEARQRAVIAADYAVLEKDEAGNPTRIHLPIDRAMTLVLQSAKAAAK